jgi:hypothetical protein
MFLLALQWGGTEYKWSSATVIGLFCGSAGMLVVFLLWEKRRGDTAMIPLSMLKNRVMYSGSLTTFFFMGNMITTSYYMAIYFQAVRGVEPTLSGVYLLPSILSQMSLAVISGILGMYSYPLHIYDINVCRVVSRLGYYLPWSIIRYVSPKEFCFLI